MKKIILFMSYYGKLPEYFDLWLDSVERNPTIDFCIISDLLDGHEIPPNVKVLSMKFSKFKEKIQDKFDFTISLDNYGRISQFRPAFGYIFDEEIKNYDFWGYVECDLILGNIRKFLDDSLLDQYEKIFKLGHLQLFKNNYKMNHLFEFETPMALSYRFAFSHNILYWEENIGMYNIVRASQCSLYREQIYGDVKWTSLPFIIVREDHNDIVRECGPYLFRYSNGNLFGYHKHNNQIIEEELIYLHLQKRKMNINTASVKEYTIIPNEFIDDRRIDVDFFDNILLRLSGKELAYKEEMESRVKKDKIKRYKDFDWVRMWLMRKLIVKNGGRDI